MNRKHVVKAMTACPPAFKVAYIDAMVGFNPKFQNYPRDARAFARGAWQDMIANIGNRGQGGIWVDCQDVMPLPPDSYRAVAEACLRGALPAHCLGLDLTIIIERGWRSMWNA